MSRVSAGTFLLLPASGPDVYGFVAVNRAIKDSFSGGVLRVFHTQETRVNFASLQRATECPGVVLLSPRMEWSGAISAPP